MRRRVWGSLALVSALVLGGAPGLHAARAAGWADKLFNEQAHDFGTVPRGAKLRHTFVLINRLNEPVTLLNVRASCGCTTGRATTSLVPPGGSAAVEAELDTRNFVGKKATVLYVSFVTASGREGEAGLGVSSTILSDIVLNPGTIDFGQVTLGDTPRLTLTVDRLGLPAWRVERMVSACRSIDASMVETARGSQLVSYLLTVQLKADAPAGTFRDEIRLFTNDPETPVFPIQVSGTVRGDVSASPSVLSLGRVASAEGAKGRFLVRASRPFVIRSVEGNGEGFKASADDELAKPVHLVTVTYRPEEGTTRGDLHHAFRVITDLAGEPPLELSMTLHVAP
jgi:hypothetical protein